jgi:hypothetical protein
MSLAKAYQEVVDFIAAGTSPQNVIAFRPSEKTKKRVFELIEREREEGLSVEEKSELEHYFQIEHLMRMAKIKAREYLHK